MILPSVLLPDELCATDLHYSWLWSVFPVGQVMRAERDAMYSEPAFYCPEVAADAAQFVGMSLAEEMAWSLDGCRACHDRLVSKGAKLSAYGFLEIAGDVADLRAALGIDAVNVYDGSYGTTPAMLLMRVRLEGVRSIILDSIYPPDVVWVETSMENMTTALDYTFAACAVDPVCNGEYPELKKVFSDVLTQLRQEPVVVTITNEAGQEQMVTVDEVKFVHFLHTSIFIGDGFTTLPASIYAAHKGDLQSPAAIWVGYVTGKHGEATPEIGSWALGMTFSAVCLQDGSMTDMATARTLYDKVDTLPSICDWGMTYMLGEWLEPCADWDVTPAQPNLAVEPVESDIPTLMLAGVFDPLAQPSNSQMAAERLSNHYYYEMPAGQGLILTDCGLELIAQFLADPTQSPDASCINEMTLNWVLPE